MTTGHFALAIISQRYYPEAPLWLLMLASWFLDLVMAFLMAMGIESITPIAPDELIYGGVIIQGYFSHSLVGALILSFMSMLLARWLWGKRTGTIVGLLVFSHWILDLIVHYPDLTIMPFNFGGLPKFGLGLWEYPILCVSLECTLAIIAIYLHYKTNKIGYRSGQPGKRIPHSTMVIATLLSSLLVFDFLALSIAITGTFIMLVMIVPSFLRK